MQYGNKRTFYDHFLINGLQEGYFHQDGATPHLTAFIKYWHYMSNMRD
jgi:hypothetical protein